jgi:uncharacterized membrane protein
VVEFFWLFPLIMMVLGAWMIWRGRRGGMMCGMMRWPRDQAERDRRSPEEPPLETLNRRYALGEIGKAEYQEKRAAITQTTPSKYQLPAGIGGNTVDH